MNVSLLPRLALMPATRDQVEVNISELITTDEFYRKGPKGSHHAVRAFWRLVALRTRFELNNNATHAIFGKLMKLTCPYCGQEMLNPVTGGGNGQEWNLHYTCLCGAAANVCVPSTGAITFTPAKLEPIFEEEKPKYAKLPRSIKPGWVSLSHPPDRWGYYPLQFAGNDGPGLKPFMAYWEGKWSAPKGSAKTVAALFKSFSRTQALYGIGEWFRLPQ